MQVQGLDVQPLDDAHQIYSAFLPEELRFNREQFDAAWDLHPATYAEIMIHGRKVLTPRWQQAFGRDYVFSGQSSRALPVPAIFQPLLAWSQLIHPKLNGLLLNWYDGQLGHYIGKHRDSTKNLIPDAPIVTISLGETRVFRLRPHNGKGMIDFEASDGKVFIMPFETNEAWTHEVPKSAVAKGRRISVTVRAFEQ